VPRSDRLSPEGIKLLQEKQLAILSTIMPDGSPQSTPVWVDVEPDGTHVLINTVVGHLKQRNVGRDPRVSVTVVDSENRFRAVLVRGIVVEQRGADQGANEHIDKLSQKYTGRERYTLREGEKRVILRIKPTHVVEQGTGSGGRWRARQGAES
jgi:PPOX class probable F420-dependent enzyme